jgi:hypothetical protein
MKKENEKFHPRLKILGIVDLGQTGRVHSG